MLIMMILTILMIIMILTILMIIMQLLALYNIIRNALYTLVDFVLLPYE